MAEMIAVIEQVPRRPRSTRAVENDQRILDAAVSLVERGGVDELSLRDVATAVGFTHGALYSRYDNVAELLVDLWQRRLGSEIKRLVEAATSIGGRTPEQGDDIWLSEPSGARRAAVELCLVADRIDELAEVIPRDVEQWMTASGLIGRGGQTDVVSLGHFCMLVGHSVVSPVHQFHAGDVLTSLQWVQLGQEPPFDGPAPEAWLPRPVEFATGDAVRDAVLRSCVSVVARSGLGRATLKRIARAAGCVPSSIYNWYDSREELLYDMVRLGIEFASVPQGDSSFGGVGAGPSLARGWAEPSAHLRRRLHLEMYLAGKHDERLAEVIDSVLSEQFALVAAELAPSSTEQQHVAIAMLRDGNVIASGISVLADLVPGLHLVDWRPYSGSMIRGAFRSAGARRDQRQ
jgi:AcrR family transcriptional regulator